MRTSRTRVAGYLSQHGVDPGSLTLEITESSLLLEAPRSRSTIQELHELGVHLSIDDFGTGYSSLSYLRQLPVSELKVDQSFIANMLIDQQDEVIVRSTIDLGHNLGLEVVAEGVESEQVLQQLRDIGCDVAQGYAVSRPLDAKRFATWLNTSLHPSRQFDPLEPATWTRADRSEHPTGGRPARPLRATPQPSPGQFVSSKAASTSSASRSARRASFSEKPTDAVSTMAITPSESAVGMWYHSAMIIFTPTKARMIASPSCRYVKRECMSASRK